jgi:hypothetical protein
MHDVSEMNSDPQFDATLARDIVIAFRERPLNLNHTLHRFECASELEQKSITDRLDLSAVEACENCPQQATMFFQQLERESFIALRQRAITNHVGKNDRGELALFGVIAHWMRPRAANGTTA